MSMISGKDTVPEMCVRRFLFSQGLRFRKNVKTLPGKPDIVLAKSKTVMFINGCFWHGHKKCKAATLPETRKEFWTKKIKANVDRDKRTKNALKETGWKVIVIWQCEIKNVAKREIRFEKLRKEIVENVVKVA
ncbi:MAG: very short patch repair endonuclease [Smithellaceae bacterium]